LESLSTRTGCWMYFAIQHPSSRSPFIHFASRKLVNEAGELVEEFHKDVSRPMSAVMRADRQSSVQAVNATIQAAARAHREELRARRAESELARLKQLLAEAQKEAQGDA
ncbi:hypothetical protein FA15DRAFT_605677, partial [Coprinopsis marcescibilis]